MAMGSRKQEQQQDLWVPTAAMPTAPGHPFYRRLNDLLREHGFDAFAEDLCQKFYHQQLGRPSIPLGVYFRMLLIGCFEGIDSERGIAWRCADSRTLSEFLGYGLTESAPDHSSLSVIRHRIDLETHREVFAWVLQVLAAKGLLKGKTPGVDATTREASAENLAAVTEDPKAAEALADRRIAEVVADKGYHSNETMRDLRDQTIRTYISEPDRGRRDWEGKAAEQAAVYANRRRIRGERGKALLRKRGELLERPFAHCYETGGMRRTHLRHHDNILKRLLVHVAGFNLGLVMRQVFGIGKPRRAQDGLAAAILASLAWILAGLRSFWRRLGRFWSFPAVAPRRTACCMAG
jgi:transposase